MCLQDKRQRVLILTCFTSSVSFACLCIALVTDYWLYATERVTNENGTVVLKNTSTGLWRKCVEGEGSSAHKYIVLHISDIFTWGGKDPPSLETTPPLDSM